MLLHVLVCTAASCPWGVAHNEILALAGGSPTTYRDVPTNNYFAAEWHVCPSPLVCSWEFRSARANWHKFCRFKQKSETGFGGPGRGCWRYGHRVPALGLWIGVSEWETPLGQRWAWEWENLFPLPLHPNPCNHAWLWFQWWLIFYRESPTFPGPTLSGTWFRQDLIVFPPWP